MGYSDFVTLEKDAELIRRQHHAGLTGFIGEPALKVDRIGFPHRSIGRQFNGSPLGGLAPTGAYIAGRRDLVEGAAMRLTCPGIGRECGSTLGNNRLLNAPAAMMT